MIPDILFGTAGTVLLLVFLYLYILAIAGLWPEKKKVPAKPARKFCIIIPAHNEAESIAETLNRTGMINYPSHLYEITVIADCCSDITADIVKRHGITCLERYDQVHRGKGFALQWALPQILASGDHDAFIIIDADTYMDKNFLNIMNRCLCNGEKAIQGYTQVRHPERSSLESLAFLGFALNRNLRYRGRSRLGLSATLLGTGMCFSRDIIEQFGWPATSMTEDVEFTMLLRIHGIRVAFAPDAAASVELHSGLNRTEGQRLRWDMGKFEIRNKYLPLLLKRGFSSHDIACIDSAMELLTSPFPIFFLFVSGCTALYLLFGINGCNWVCMVWLTVFTALVVYTILGLISAKAGLKTYLSLLHAPFFLAWRCWILIREYLKGNRGVKW